MTRRYAEVIGDPIAQSKSPLIHRFWLDRLGIDAEYRACLVPTNRLAAHVAARRGDPVWRGCNVTMPHKLAAMDLVDDLDASARGAGAVNTILREADRLIGYNTDVDGVREALAKPENLVRTYPGHVATYVQIIGAGGAARAAAAAVGAGADMAFYNRDARKAVALATRFGLPEGFGMTLEALGPIRNPGDGPADQRYSHVVINASSMGMAGNAPVPIDLARYHADTVVFDMVYAPLDTPLLRRAREVGLRTIDGLEMLVGQAAVAFRLFFGLAPPREADAELRRALVS